MLKIIYTAVVGVLLVAVATVVLIIFPDGQSVLGADVIFHFLGGAFAAWCGYLFSRKIYLVWLVVLVMAVGWEFLEYFSSVFGPTYWPAVANYYHSGGPIDTLADLVVDIFGAGTFILLYCCYYGSHQQD